MDAAPNPLLANMAPPGLGTGIAMPSTAPSMGTPVLPSVSLAPPPPPTQTQMDITKRNDAVNKGSGIDQIQNPLLRGIARAADIAGSVFAPNLAQFIPGTTLHHQLVVNQMGQNVAKDQAEEQATAQTANEAATTAHTNAATANTQAETAGLPTVQADKHILSQAQAGNLDSETSARDTPKPKSPEQQVYDEQIAQGKTPTEAFTAVNQAKNTKDATFQQQFLDAYRKAHPGISDTDAISATIRATSTEPKIQVINAGAADRAAAKNVGLDTSDPAMQASVNAVANGSMKLGDVFGRGATTAQKAQFAAAVKAVNPNYNSGDHDIENAVRRDFTSGHDSDTVNAINTAYNHLDKFAAAAQALKGGSSKAMNEMANALGVQFQQGASPQVISDLVKQALKGEVSRAFTGAGATVDEQRNLDTSFSNANSLDTMLGVVSEAKGLLKGKETNLQNKFNSGTQGKPNFIGENAPKDGDTKTNSHGDKVTFKGGKWGPA